MASHMAIKMIGLGGTVTGFTKALVFTWPPLKGYEGNSIMPVTLGFSIWTPMFSLPAGTPHDLEKLMHREVEVGFEPKPRVIGSGPCKVSFLRWRKRSDDTYIKDGSFTLGMRCKGVLLENVNAEFLLGKGISGPYQEAEKQLKDQGYK